MEARRILFELLLTNGLGHRILMTASLTLLFTILGPFATYDDLSLPARFGYWAVTIATCGIIFRAVIGTVFDHEGACDWHWTLRIAAGALLACLPAGVVVALAEWVFRENARVF